MSRGRRRPARVPPSVPGERPAPRSIRREPLAYGERGFSAVTGRYGPEVSYVVILRPREGRGMNVDIDRLARYPTESDDWIVTVLIGGIAMLLSILVVPWFVVSGYLVRDLRAGMENAEEPHIRYGRGHRRRR